MLTGPGENTDRVAKKRMLSMCHILGGDKVHQVST